MCKRRRKDKHDAVVERFAAGIRVGFLRVACARANDKMRMMARVQDDFADGFQVGNLFAQLEREINPRLRLIFGGMFLRVGIKNGAARFARRGQRNFVTGVFCRRASTR